MDKRERTLNAMRGLPVDRVPTTFYRHLTAFGNDEESMIAGQVRSFHDSEMDFLVEETDGYMEYPLPGGDPKELASWKGNIGLSRNHPFFTEQIERTKRLIDGIEAPLFFIIYTPLSFIKHTTLDETTIMGFYKEDRKTLAEAMKVMEDVNFELMRRLKDETDTTGFFVSMQQGEIDRFAKDEYMEYCYPWDERLTNYANELAEDNIMHLCSWCGVPNNLDLWTGLDFKVVNWSVNIEKDLDMRRAREFFRPGTVLMGGFDNRAGKLLHTGSEEEIRKETIRQIQLAGGQDAMILCADCSVQNDQDDRKLAAVAHAAQKYAEGRREIL